MATHNPKLNNGIPLSYHETIIKLRDELRKSKSITRVEYYYTNDRTDNGVDFDNLFIRRDATLTVSSDGDGLIIQDSNGKVVNPEDCVMAFKSRIQDAMRSLGISASVKRRDKTNVIEVTYQSSGWKMGANRRFVIDAIFCLEILYREDLYKLYVPAILEDGEDNPGYWSVMKNTDTGPAIVQHGNKIRRWAVRFQCALAERDSSLNVLSPTVYEHAIGYLKNQTGVDFWKEDNLRKIVEMLMKFVAKALKERHTMDGSGLHSVLPPMSAVVRENAVLALQGLATEHHVQAILESV